MCITQSTKTIPVRLAPVRLIIACTACARQFDGTGQPAGRRFRCKCGEILTVQPVQEHDAAVVRCSACGAPRQGRGAECAHCGADFTLHERDLHTICPNCLTRISDRARFCHSCGLAIGVAGDVGQTTELKCPVCGEGHLLARRTFGSDAGAELAIHECGKCAGMWLDNATFEHVVAQAETLSSTIHGPATPERRAAAVEGTPSNGPMYRPCVRCGNLMNRQNFGKRSNVVIDVCKEHGAWFDAHELGRILDWVRSGGLEQMRRDERERLRDERRRTARASQPPPFSRAAAADDDRGPDLLGALLRWFW